MTPSAQLPDRSSLATGAIPSIVLSDGSDSSMTPMPKVAIASDPEVGAKNRFTVIGNMIITGGSGVLRLTCCDALLEHGLSGLVIFHVNPAHSQKEIEALTSKFPKIKIEYRKVDVTDKEAVSKAVSETVETLGSVDGLVCFVRIVGCVNTLDMPVSQWRRIIDANTTGSFICAQGAARQIVSQGTGSSITFTASISAHCVNYPQPQSAYYISKAALLMLKNCLAAEWAQYGIRTSSISPGYIDTILNEGDGIAGHRSIWAALNPSGRMGSPFELTGAVVLLASTAGITD